MVGSMEWNQLSKGKMKGKMKSSKPSVKVPKNKSGKPVTSPTQPRLASNYTI
jgi:hypothetical protein